MDHKDRGKIDYFCNHLLPDVNIFKLWPKLLDHKIYNRDDVNIPNWEKNLSSQDTIFDICNTIKTRGPRAYSNFLRCLNESDHKDIVDKLENYSSSNKVNKINNATHNIETLSISNETSHASNFEEHLKDDFYTKIYSDVKPLVIKVKKAKDFKDTPDFKHIWRYPMKSNPRGLVLIITNINYSMLDNRPGALYDKENLQTLFENMGFQVITHTDLKGVEVKEKVKEFSQMKELRRVDSAFIIISSHGTGERGRQETEIKGTDYDLKNYESVFCTNIVDYFNGENCPHLREKPKVFIFQTCRGDDEEMPVYKDDLDAKSGKEPILKPNRQYNVQSTRNNADMLIAYATLPGYVSYRDKYNGSWFIQILCEVFMNHACDRHVQDLFTMTDSRLKDLRTAYDECQTLWVVNQGFRHCYLNPGLFLEK